jgi:DNA-binding HxlR family transcriptional regulator
MSAKENAAVGQLLELLEARYALARAVGLKDGHPQTFRLLQDSIGSITPNTLNTRIKELRAAGLLATAATATPSPRWAATCSSA